MKFTTRDLCWLMLVVAVAAAWFVDRATEIAAHKYNSQRLHDLEKVCELVEESGCKVTIRRTANFEEIGVSWSDELNKLHQRIADLEAQLSKGQSGK